MDKEIKFLYFPNNTYIITKFIEDSSLYDYKDFLEENNIFLSNIYFIQNLKILDIKITIKNIDNIIIIPKSLFRSKSAFPVANIAANTIVNTTENITENITENTTTNSAENTTANSAENTTANTDDDTKINIDEKTSHYLTLLQKYPDLIAFIIILKTDIIDYIILYLEKYKKKNIYNIIRNNQQEIINMLEENKSFINLYIRTCNVNVLSSLLNYSYNNIIISQIENIFPDVPCENIEELIDIFS